MTKNKLAKIIAGIGTLALLQAGLVYAAGEPASLDADVVEYDTKTSVVTATGNVLMKRGTSKVAGAKATYNVQTQAGTVEGNVIAVRENLRITCQKLVSDGQEHMQALGGVHATELDREFIGEQVDYFPNQNKYILIETGGMAKSKDGTFTADRLEGWMDDEHYIGTGNAHLISSPRDLEAGGDRCDYYGKEEGKAILTGNAWAIQDNNTVKSNKMIIYLAKDGNAKVQ